MKIRDIPRDTSTLICDHLFEKSNFPKLLACEHDGELVVTCGCEVKKAHLIGFGHLRKYFSSIYDNQMPLDGSYYALNEKTKEWKFSFLSDEE